MKAFLIWIVLQRCHPQFKSLHVHHNKSIWLKPNSNTWELLVTTSMISLTVLYFFPVLTWTILILFHLLERSWPENTRDVQWELTLAQLTRVLQCGWSSTVEWRSSTMTKATIPPLLVLLSQTIKGWLVKLLKTRLLPTQRTLCLVSFLFLSVLSFKNLKFKISPRLLVGQMNDQNFLNFCRC